MCPGIMTRMRHTVPPINDITTDTDDPPAFAAVIAARTAEAGNPVAYHGAEIRRPAEASLSRHRPSRADAAPKRLRSIARSPLRKGWAGRSWQPTPRPAGSRRANGAAGSDSPTTSSFASLPQGSEQPRRRAVLGSSRARRFRRQRRARARLSGSVAQQRRRLVPSTGLDPSERRLWQSIPKTSNTTARLACRCWRGSIARKARGLSRRSWRCMAAPGRRATGSTMFPSRSILPATASSCCRSSSACRRQARYPETVADVNFGIRFLKANAERFATQQGAGRRPRHLLRRAPVAAQCAAAARLPLCLAPRCRERMRASPLRSPAGRWPIRSPATAPSSSAATTGSSKRTISSGLPRRPCRKAARS